jgi:precorrin-8X/cobalt-precorrin-8 methylmutase
LPEPLFDRFVFVDWSASSRPGTGRDSVWIADGNSSAVRTHNPPTRQRAVDDLRGLLASAVAAAERILVGFDFPYGYPAGFADALGLVAVPPRWRRIWDELGSLVTDNRRNQNNRFEVAGQLNQRLGPKPGPFWGCSAAAAGPHLSPTKGSFPYRTGTNVDLAEYRITEQRARRWHQLSSTWKLAFQPTVGSQALLGIPRLANLRCDPALADYSKIWPFETGLSIEAESHRPYVLHCEIWPRVIDVDPTTAPSGTLDEAQVLGLVAWASVLNSAGQLGNLFAPAGLTTAQVGACVAEEGWILGVH